MSSVTFKQSGADRWVACLGMHQVGTIVPRKIGAVDCLWSCCLPPMSELRWQRAASVSQAQSRLRDFIEQWVEAAGLRPPGDVASASKRNKQEH